MTQKPRRRRRKDIAFGRVIRQLNVPEKGRLNDVYHWLLTCDRLSFAATVMGFYLGVNTMFALAYVMVGGIENARPGSFADAFFFSVQTMATIGYGRMVPLSMAANSLVAVEAGIGLFGIAMAASLLFARFTRATAGVRFSEHAVVTMFDGKPTLMFRIANERVARINEASIYLVAARQEVTVEGQAYRRLYDITAVRSFSPVFELSWTVMHVLDETSPLCACTPESLADTDATITAVFTGHHEGFQQRVHARHSYDQSQLMWDHRFVDLFKRDEEGVLVIDHANFDAVQPVSAAHRIKKR